jgi:hypothetical protein
MVISLTLMIAAESFFIYKLVRIYQPATAGTYYQVKGSLTTFRKPHSICGFELPLSLTPLN